MNLLEEVEGKLPGEKEKMLATIDRYLAMPGKERLLFRLGRRGGALRTLDEIDDPAIRRRLEAALADLSPEAGGGCGEANKGTGGPVSLNLKNYKDIDE